MDNPNTVLDEMRDLVDKIWNEAETPDEAASLGDSLAQKFEELDNWLVGSGPFPEDWTRMRNMLRN